MSIYGNKWKDTRPQDRSQLPDYEQKKPQTIVKQRFAAFVVSDPGRIRTCDLLISVPATTFAAVTH